MMEAEAILNCRPLTIETINSTDGRVSHTQPLTYHEVQGDIVPTWRIPACRSVLKEKMAQGAIPC